MKIHQVRENSELIQLVGTVVSNEVVRMWGMCHEITLLLIVYTYFRTSLKPQQLDGE